MSQLPDGLYPLDNETLPFSELAMAEVPPQLESLFK